VLHYLARYTHGFRPTGWSLLRKYRVAISNHRLVDVTDTHVSFRWKDYAHHSRRPLMILSHEEFLRRFLQHVLPRGFPRIRYFGVLANRRRGELLPLCRTLLLAPPMPVHSTSSASPAPWGCSCCQGPMRLVERLTANQLHRNQSSPVGRLDSS
jgi:hypothetical protein